MEPIAKYKWNVDPIEGVEEVRPSEPTELWESEIQKILGEETDSKKDKEVDDEQEEEGEQLDPEEARKIGSSVFLKIIEIEKEEDLSWETLSILKDFSINHLYLMLSNGPEDKPRKERALSNLEQLEFFGDYQKEDF